MSAAENSDGMGSAVWDAGHGPSVRVTVEEIAARLAIGRVAVYEMLNRGIIPGIRLGRRWIITRHAYEQWERTCGIRSQSGLDSQPEVTVLN